MFIIKSDDLLIYYPGSETASVTNAVLTETLNDAGSLVFTLPITNGAYTKIVEGITKIQLYRDSEIIWRGFVESTSVNFRQDKTVTCIGELSYLTRSPQYQSRFMDKKAAYLLYWYLREHNKMCDEQFTRGNVVLDADVERSNIYTNYESTLEAIRTNICDKFGVYMKIRYEDGTRYLDLYDINNYGKLADQTIQFGKNLLDYAKNISTSDIYTQILPLGAIQDTQYIVNLDNRLNIESVNEGKQYLENAALKEIYGARMCVVTWDDVTIASNLKTKAQEWLNSQQFERIQLNLTAVDLALLDSSIDSFELGDRVRVVAPVYNLDITLPVMSKTTNLQSPDKNQIVIGNNVQLTYTQMQSAPSAPQLKQNDAWSGSVSVGGNITMNGGEAANIIRFLSSNHNSYFYGGNDGSSIAIGCWDAKDPNNSHAIWRYQDTTGKLALYCGGSLNNLEDMIVDSGTQDSWEYIKFASGLYICSKRMSLNIAMNSAQGSIYYGDSPAISFPITFKAVPSINANGTGTSTTNAWYSVISATASNCKVRGWRGTSASSSSYGLTVTVIGRWQ